MARFDIVSQGGVVRYTGAPTYNGIFGKASYVEFSEIASPVPIAWEVGDYLDYTRTGLRYKLYSIPQPERRARSGSSGEAVVYRNVQLFDATKELEICPFNDLVMGDNLIHYSSQPDVNTYENVQGIADRIQANLDSFYGEGVWSIVLYAGDADVTAIMSEAKEFSLSDGNCMAALDAIYNTWKGIGWVHTYVGGVNIITIGRPNVQDGSNSTDLFTYGRGNGLTILATSLSSQNELATRIYPFGSTRNMIARYYNSKSSIKDYESVYIPNLMLPITSWGQTDGKYDPRLAYIENTNATSKYGLRVKRIYFDGSGEYDEIYPSIENVTAKNIRDAKTATGDSTYVPSTTEYVDSERMDFIKEPVAMPADNGIMSDDGKKYVESVTGTSSLNNVSDGTIPRIGETYRYSEQFGIATVSGGGDLTISSNYIRTISIDKDSAPDVRYQVNVYCDGSLVQQREYTADVYGNGNDRIFRFAFPDLTFKLTTGGSLSIVVVAIVSAAPGTQFSEGQNSAPVSYELKKSFDDTFSLKLKQIGFDISKQQSSISDGLCTLNMKSGMCAGRGFVIKSVTYNSEGDDWTVVCYRQEDSSLGQYFPNSIYEIVGGDQFVLTDLEMPEMYINIAAAKLYDAATELLAKLSTPKIIYEPEIDAKVVAEYGDILKEGMYMSVGDSELIGNAPVYVLIDTLTIYENESNIPTYKVSLRDERYENTIARLTGEISRLNAQRRASMYDDARSRYLNETAGEDSGDPSVAVAYDMNTFSYADAETVNPLSISLLAVVKNVPTPEYQWEYLDGLGWEDITGATSESLTVTPDNSQYFGDDDVLVATIRCSVSDGTSSYTSEPVAITKIMGGVGTPGEDAWILSLAPPTLQIPTDSSYHVISGSTLPTSQATLNKGNSYVPGVTYALDNDSTIYFNGDVYTYVNDTYEVHDGNIYDSEYENYDGDIILLESGMHNIWDGSSVREDFTLLLQINQGLSINSAGLITVANNILFTEDCLTRIVGVAASVVVDGVTKTFRTNISVSAQVKGADGSPGSPGSNGYTSTRIQIFQRSANGVPAKPTENVTYNISTGAVTYGSLSPWSLVAPEGDDPLYTSFYYLSSNSTGVSYTLFKGQWTTPSLYVESGVSPLIVVADRGIVGIPTTSSGVIITPTNPVSIQCHLRKGSEDLSGASWDLGCVTSISYYGMSNLIPFYEVDNEMEYDGVPYPYHWYDPSTENEAWTKTRNPVVSDDCLDISGEPENVSVANTLILGISIDSNGLITGTPTYLNSDAVAVSVTATKDGESATTYITFEKNKNGERGFAGKVMRGVNEYDPNNSFDYQGMDDTDASHIYYDVVSYTSNGTTKLYYCKIYKKGNTYAKAITPGSDSDVWVEATDFDFVATNLLLAQNAFIDFIGSQGLYLKNGNNVVAGGQGGNGIVYWAGTTGSNPDIPNAPFRVYYDGSVVANNGTFSGTIQATSGYFSGRLMLPFVEISSDKTLSASDSSSIIIPTTAAGSGSGNGYTLTLPNSTDFNGWVLNVYVSPRVIMNEGYGKIASSAGDSFGAGILVPEKSTLPGIGFINNYYASLIEAQLGGFFQFMCVSGRWVLINYNAAEVVFTQAA